MNASICSIRAVANAALVQLDLPRASWPRPGQYLLVDDAVLARPLFRAGDYAQGWLHLPGGLPPTWLPGTSVAVRGPLGKGFALPETVSRLALAALGETAVRLLPLLELASEADAVLFSQPPWPEVPARVELYPLSEFPAALGWAEFIALDVPLAEVESLPRRLGLAPEQGLPCPAQVLISAPMPCGGLADCGVCAFPARRGYRLACRHGPVFDWRDVGGSR